MQIFYFKFFFLCLISESNSLASHFFPGSPQKGRPRKRKQLQNLNSGRETPMRMGKFFLFVVKKIMRVELTPREKYNT